MLKGFTTFITINVSFIVINMIFDEIFLLFCSVTLPGLDFIPHEILDNVPNTDIRSQYESKETDKEYKTVF